MIDIKSQKIRMMTLLLLGFSLSVASCSKSIFDGDRSNDRKESQLLTNQSCFDIDLSSNQLDPSSFRNLIRCLNDNNSIPEYASLVNQMTDAQLNGLLEIVNQVILPNQKLLTSLVQSFDDLEKQGVLDSLFNQLSRLLTQRASIISALQLIHQSAFINGKLDPDILTMIHVLTGELNSGKGSRENIKYILEKTIRYTQLDSYQQIIQNVTTPIPDGHFTLYDLSSKTLKYIQEKILGKHPLLKLILLGVKDGSFYKLLHQYLYPGCANPPLDDCSQKQLEPQVQALEDFFKIVMVEHKEDVLKKTIDLHIALDRPIDCADDTKRINDGNMYLMDLFNQQEPLHVPAWLMRNDILLLKLSATECNLPKNFNTLLEPLRVLADYKGTNSLGKDISHQPLVTYAYLLKAMLAADQLDPKIHSERYRRMFIHWIGDKTSTNIYTNLADTLGVLAQKNILANALYFMNATSAESEDQKDWMDLAGILMTPRPELKIQPLISRERSVYDVLSSVILQINQDVLYRFLLNLSDVLESNQDYLTPTLNIIREALLTNDLNPILELLIKVGGEASRYSAFYNSIFELSETKAFEDSLQLTAKLSQNGDLKEILRGFLLLFGRIQTEPYTHKYFSSVATIQQTQNRSSNHQNPTPTAKPYWPEKPTHSTGSIEACKNIDVEISLADTKNKKWSSQAIATIDCLNASGDYRELAEAYKNDLSVPSPFFNGKSLAVFLIDRFADFFTVPGSQPQASLFKKKLYDEIHDHVTNQKLLKETQDSIKALKYLTSNPRGEKTAPLQSAFRVLSLFNDKKDPLQELLNFVASMIENPKSAKATALIYDVSKETHKTATPTAALKPYLRSALPAPFTEHFIENQLKPLLVATEFDPQTPLNDDKVERRVDEVMDDYWHQVVTGRHKMSFENAEDFKAYLKPLLDDLAQPRALETTLKFLDYMDHNPYDPEWWESWFKRLSSNIRAMPYYYPGNYPDSDGNGKPTIRLVNQLELLDLVVIESDFTMKGIHQWRPDILPDSVFPPENENGAIRYLTKLAQADDAKTPEQVEALTQEWVNSILKDEAKYIDVVFHGGEKLLGGKTSYLVGGSLKKRMQPETRRRVANLNHILPILQELNQNKERAKLRNGKEIWRSDLGILRSLFHAVLQATPFDGRNDYTKEANSLRLITHLVTSGIFRAISMNMWSQDSGGIHSTRVLETIKLIIDAVRDPGAHDGLNRDTKDILSFLLRNNAKPGYGISDNPYNYALGDFDSHYIFIGQIIDHVFDWMEDDGHHGHSVLTLLKRSFYELSLLLEQMEHDRSRRGLTENLPREVVKVLKPFVGTKEGTEWIASNMDTVKSLLTDPDSTKFLVRLMEAQSHSKKKNGYKEKDGFRDFIELANGSIDELSANHGHLASTVRDLMIRLDQDPKHIYFNQMSKVFSGLNHDPDFAAFKKQTLNHVFDDFVYGMINPNDEKAWPIQLRGLTVTNLRNGNIASLIGYIGTHSQDDYFFHHDVSFLGKTQYVDGIQSMLSKLGFDLHDIFKSP